MAVIMKEFYRRFKAITHDIPGITHVLTFEGANTVWVNGLEMSPVVEIGLCLGIHDDAEFKL